MNRIVFLDEDLESLLSSLRASHQEACAILFLSESRLPTGDSRFLVTDVLLPESDDYTSQGEFHAELTPSFVAAVTKKARLQGKSVGFVHTHPGATAELSFSSVDDRGEELLVTYLARRDPERRHIAMVVDAANCRARILGTSQDVQISSIGEKLKITQFSAFTVSAEEAYDRQIRAFGIDGQRALSDLKVGIVGLGGTGSVVAQQLAYLGVQDFLLIDHDAVDRSNLNRLVGASENDEGNYKVDVAARNIRTINSSSSCTAVKGNIVYESTARQLLDRDILFCCTDSHGSRAILNQMAYQYLLPCIDMGVVIVTRNGGVSHIAGRVQMLSPGFGCLVCSNLLDYNAIRHDLMTPQERKADPYFLGERVAQPAVVSLNSTVASLAITMLLGIVTDIPSGVRLLHYNGIRGTVRPAIQPQTTLCVACSPQGALRRGDTWPLPVRRE